MEITHFKAIKILSNSLLASHYKENTLVEELASLKLGNKCDFRFSLYKTNRFRLFPNRHMLSIPKQHVWPE